MDVSIGTGRGMKGKRDRFEAEGRSRELIVFSIVRESKCSECNKELVRGEFLFKDGERGLCMTCADLDELVYLPSGDAALSRRARMHSPLSAVVVRFSRARKRYERQGILVSEVALEQAEAECLADSESRALQRERNAQRRAQYDRDLVAQMTGEISRLFPGCPPKVAQTIAEHAAFRGRGTDGRTRRGHSLPEEALTLSSGGHTPPCSRHYYQLLTRRRERTQARA